MNRRFAIRSLLACLLAVTATAPVAAARVVATGAAKGTVTYVGGSSFTIQTAGRQIGVVNALTAAAAAVTNHNYPYVYGGGHAQAGIASTGVGRRGSRRVGFDCSGSVAAVLASGGLWQAGSGVPNDAGVIGSLRARGLIARGVGRGPVEVTLYDRPGVHIFMNIDGRFFGTSDGAGGGNPHGGAGWLDDGAPDASRSAFRAYHIVPRALHSSASSGHIVSFQAGQLQALASGLAVGDPVQVSYAETSSGALVAKAITFPGATTTGGIVSAIAGDGGSFAIQTPSGTTLTFLAHTDQLIQDLVLGDTVQVTYTTSGGTLTARVVTVAATPPTGASTGADGGGYAGYGSYGSPGDGY